MTIKEKTDARITTQLALRDTANTIEEFSFEKFVSKFQQSKTKYTRKNSIRLNEEVINNELKGSVIYQKVIKAKQKTSKKSTYLWLYLFYDHNKPFTRREEHILPIYITMFNTKKPTDVRSLNTGMFLTRHFLERVALHLDAKNLEDMLGFFTAPIDFLFIYHEVRPKIHEVGGIVVINKNEYIIIDKFEEYNDEEGDDLDAKVIFKTFLPLKKASKYRLNRMRDILQNIENGHDFQIVSIKEFNSEGNEPYKTIDDEVLDLLGD